jgi:hypothetical protein
MKAKVVGAIIMPSRVVAVHIVSFSFFFLPSSMAFSLFLTLDFLTPAPHLISFNICDVSKRGCIEVLHKTVCSYAIG